jgi:MYXO-CTERM domain-containing protein
MSKHTSLVSAVAASALLVSGVAFADFYSIGDGVADSAVGVNDPATSLQAVYLNTFSLTGSDTAINQISIAFGISSLTNLVGQSFTAVIYSDANGGTPWDGTLVWSSAGTISSVATFIDIAVPDVAVAGNFAVGFLFTSPAGGSFFPAGWDTTAPVSNRSYAAFGATVDINNLSSVPAGQFGTIESFGLPGNWTITANGVPAPGAVALLGIAGLVGRRRR